MKPLRSLLFVPGHKLDWVDKAWKVRPDGVVLDLEDAVPPGEKAQGRQAVRQVLEQWSGREAYFCVRVNALVTGLTFEDLEAVVHPSLSSIMLPKVAAVEDVAELDVMLRLLERRRGLKEGHVALNLLLETAPGMLHAYQIATSCPRVDMVTLAAGPGGDAAWAIGYQWTKSGTETLFLRSKIVLDCRAAGVHPMITSWYDIKDLEGLGRDARLNRQLGYGGMVLIHPSHVAVVNEVFSPTPQELAYYKGLIEAVEEAEKQGRGAVIYQGDMVDYAMVQTARGVLELARKLGLSF